MYTSNSTMTTGDQCKVSIYRQKTFTIYIAKTTPRVPLNFLKVLKIKFRNFNFALLSSFFQKLKNYKMYRNILHIKRLPYYHRSSFSCLEVLASYDWLARVPNTHLVIFHTLFCAYFHAYLETIGCMQMFYIVNYSSTIKDVPFLA